MDTLSLEGIGNGISSISNSQYRRTMLYPLLSAEYIKKINSHNLKVLILAEQTSRRFSQFSATRKNLFTTSIPELFIGSENEQTNDGFSGSNIGRKSLVTRVNYRFKDRYLFESTFRADGNVLFAPKRAKKYFKKTIYPMLTPMVFDNLHSFPILMNKVLIFGVVTRSKSDEKKKKISFIQIPLNIPTVSIKRVI